MVRGWCVALFGACLCLSVAGSPARAASPARPSTQPDCSRPLTLGLHDHGLLYSQDTGQGIDRDIADALAARSGCRIVVSLLPRARIWQLLETGALDFSLSGISNPEREVFASFAWYFANKYYLLLRKDAGPGDVDGFLRDRRLHLGVIRSFRYGTTANEFVDRLQENQRVTYAGALPPLYEMLMNNQIQGMIIEPFDYPALQEHSIRETTRIVEFDDPAIPHGLIMSRKSLPPAEQDKWRALIRTMRDDGTMLSILEKYFPGDIARQLLSF